MNEKKNFVQLSSDISIEFEGKNDIIKYKALAFNRQMGRSRIFIRFSIDILGFKASSREVSGYKYQT
jgi:hypothetical protein